MQIDLARSPEKNAVLVDEIDLAGCFDSPEDLRRIPGWIRDFVKCRPLCLVGFACALIESQRRVFADVERFPVQHRLRFKLANRHYRPAVLFCLRRKACAHPKFRVFSNLWICEICRNTGCDLKPAHGKPPRDDWQCPAGKIQHILRGGSSACSILHRFDGIYRLSRSCECVLGVLLCSYGCGVDRARLLCCSAAASAERRAATQDVARIGACTSEKNQRSSECDTRRNARSANTKASKRLLRSHSTSGVPALFTQVF